MEGSSHWTFDNATRVSPTEWGHMLLVTRLKKNQICHTLPFGENAYNHHKGISFIVSDPQPQVPSETPFLKCMANIAHKVETVSEDDERNHK